jgi:anti-sigma regulatory factor (Ser/Thr protein kinase)
MLARIAVGSLIRDFPHGVATDVAVLTSELVSDAVEHAWTTEWEEIVVRVNRDKRIRVEVIDGGTGFNPSAPVCPGLNESGLGPFLVDQLASAWGVDRRGDCTIVWFEVDSETSRGAG